MAVLHRPRKVAGDDEGEEAVTYVDHYKGDRVQTWRTPRKMFDPLDAEFDFTLDGAATEDNALLPRWNDGMDTWTGDRVFCNPPWNDIRPFVDLAATADVAVLLVPARVNTRWFHHALSLGAEVRYFLGKPRFSDGPGNSPVDCLYLIFRKEQTNA